MYGTIFMESRSALIRVCQPGHRKTCFFVIVLGIIIGSIILASTAFANRKNDFTLKKVFILFRHGNRNPTETYPNDPYLHYNWPNGWGSLTKTGMRQMHKLGKMIRRKFGWITENKYTPSSTVVNSSYADRCIMSSQALLAGLYPPREDEVFAEGLLWRPIPVHYVPRNMDTIIVVTKSCPRLEKELKEAYHNESLKSDVALKSYYEKLSDITGKSMKTVTDIEFLYNTLEIEVIHGLELPSSIKKYFNDEMQKIAAQSYTLFTSNTLQQRLRGGPMLKHILETMKYGGHDEKMYLYGTHDVTLVNILRAMGFTNELFKLDFGATLIFELQVKDEGYRSEVWISILNNTDTTELYSLHIPSCGYSCQLDDLFNIWKDVIPDDWEKECKL